MRFRAAWPGGRRGQIIKWSLTAVVGVLAVVIDLVTKSLAEQHLALGETREILPFLSLERTANSGVAFGLLSGHTSFIVVANAIALLVVLAYVFMEPRPYLAGISGGFVIGGSVGNLVQRLSGDGRVTDFLKLPSWPNFNMADVFLDVGICIIVIGFIVEAVKLWRSGRKETPVS